MKKTTLLLAAILVSLVTANAHALTFVPPSPELQNLNHERYVIWGINWSVPTGQMITSASVTFHDIYNWTAEADDRLWLHLLQSAPSGLTGGQDNEASGTWFAPPRYTAEQTLLNEFDDLPEGSSQKQDITYDFSGDEMDLLRSYSAAGHNFGLGFDPDCHYYNSGVELKITTAVPPVPEPGTLALLGIGLVGFAGTMKRKLRRS